MNRNNNNNVYLFFKYSHFHSLNSLKMMKGQGLSTWWVKAVLCNVWKSNMVYLEMCVITVNPITWLHQISQKIHYSSQVSYIFLYRLRMSCQLLNVVNAWTKLHHILILSKISRQVGFSEEELLCMLMCRLLVASTQPGNWGGGHQFLVHLV
jgi:hypothetical protein